MPDSSRPRPAWNGKSCCPCGGGDPPRERSGLRVQTRAAAALLQVLRLRLEGSDLGLAGGPEAPGARAVVASRETEIQDPGDRLPGGMAGRRKGSGALEAAAQAGVVHLRVPDLQVPLAADTQFEGALDALEELHAGTAGKRGEPGHPFFVDDGAVEDIEAWG